MGDIYCAVCGEPWDRMSVQYEFTEEEREKFLSGRGCPSCKGKGERNLKTIERFIWSALDSTDEDPIDVMDRMDFGRWDE